MTVPAWLAAVIADFGKGAGLGDLKLGERGTVAMRFANGTTFRLEYTGSHLATSVTVPYSGDVAQLKRLLAQSHPDSKLPIPVRTGLFPKSRALVAAIVTAERDVTLPLLNSQFSVLWRLAEETGGAR